MRSEKQLQIANFNLTFGQDNYPMLEYFEEIFYPALKEKEEIRVRDSYYNFENIKMVFKNEIFILTGLLVKSTTLEVYSKYNEDGELQQTNQKIPTDPYSYFVINLKNHRVALVKNQKGSPTLKDLEKAISSTIKQYINKENKKDLRPQLNVVPIPHSGKIQEELKRVKKVEQFTLRFYPLNGDVSTNKIFNSLREMLEEMDSKSGNTTINTPNDIEEVGRVLSETKGLVKPVLRVIYNNDAKRTLRENNFSEATKIRLDNEEGFDKNIEEITRKIEHDLDYNKTSEENKMIYDRNIGELEKIFKRGR